MIPRAMLRQVVSNVSVTGCLNICINVAKKEGILSKIYLLFGATVNDILAIIISLQMIQSGEDIPVTERIATYRTVMA